MSSRPSQAKPSQAKPSQAKQLLVTIEIVNHTRRPAEIRNYSTSRYTSHDYMEAEWDEVWRKSWLLAGLVSDVQNMGDYFVFDMGRAHIPLIRSSVTLTS